MTYFLKRAAFLLPLLLLISLLAFALLKLAPGGPFDYSGVLPASLPSSRGLGRGPLKAETRVRIP